MTSEVETFLNGPILGRSRGGDECGHLQHLNVDILRLGVEIHEKDLQTRNLGLGEELQSRKHGMFQTLGRKIYTASWCYSDGSKVYKPTR